MREIQIERYTPEMEGDWNDFVAASRNGTFLFNRGYMDYHADRFRDHSLLAKSKGKILAMLPACERESGGERLLSSHAGLTYGGWILKGCHTYASDMLGIFSALREYAVSEGFNALDYKPIPYIYAAMPSEDDRYAIFREGGGIRECNIASVIDMRQNPGFNTQQKRNLKRGVAGGAEIIETQDVGRFYTLLQSCLRERYDVSPVHSESELRLLSGRFPSNIKFFMALGGGGEAEAGVCVYDTGRVAHVQYICSSEAGREKGSLTLLFSHLIGRIYAGREYFDFGTSNEMGGRVLNEGLNRQKCGLGGSGVAYERYLIRY